MINRLGVIATFIVHFIGITFFLILTPFAYLFFGVNLLFWYIDECIGELGENIFSK